LEFVPCDICGSAEAELFAKRPPRDDVLHARFVRCRSCGAIYASPRATVKEAQAYYSAVTQRGAAVQGHDVSRVVWDEAVAARQPHLREAEALLAHTDSAKRFLDIGFGDASSLAAAANLGWEPHGLEYSDWLVAWASERLGLTTLRTGGLEEAKFPDDHFDVVYSWHVIEHVLDLDSWLKEINRIIKPGGILVLGTENADSLYGKLWTFPFRVIRRVPWPPTSTDHTHWFSATSLGRVLTRNGFKASVRPYENPPVSILRSQSPSVIFAPRQLAQATAYFTSAVIATVRPASGGKLVAFATLA
jgi:2-polyprenyl-3-methyl-5-hydroxy-6-metoxy-1,4-benzoquinol methylase